MENLNKLTTDELRELQTEIGDIIYTREKDAKQKLWAGVVEAMGKYITEFGDPDIDDDYAGNVYFKCLDLEEPGTIFIGYTD